MYTGSIPVLYYYIKAIRYQYLKKAEEREKYINAIIDTRYSYLIDSLCLYFVSSTRVFVLYHNATALYSILMK